MVEKEKLFNGNRASVLQDKKNSEVFHNSINILNTIELYIPLKTTNMKQINRREGLREIPNHINFRVH